jgi:tetratricopeptide (TPR) repeat protein
MRTVLRLVRIAVALLAVGTAGCASTISHWIVNTRDHQGDVALAHRNDADASIAYQLALRVDPHDNHAKVGLVTAQTRLATALFATSRFDEAVAALQIAGKYAPGNPQIQSLQGEIEQAEIKRDIVVSNYPAYREVGASIRRQVDGFAPTTKHIGETLQRFDYTYDSNELTEALRECYQLDDDVRRVTARLIRYRQLVDAGAPESDTTDVEPPASLLPLP